MSLYAIWDNLLLFLVKVNQNFSSYIGLQFSLGTFLSSPARIVIAVFINSQQPLQEFILK